MKKLLLVSFAAVLAQAAAASPAPDVTLRVTPERDFVYRLGPAVAIASAPAMKRRGGGSFLAIVMSARASLAGSPDCKPFCVFQNSSCAARRSS
jgi:hypothetical protein